MDLRVLNYFLMVAREGNITKAAQLLHISQPTLSRQLMQLEEELSVKLFQRGKHNVYLTSEGTLFRRRAQEIINLANKAKSELTQEDENLSGTISLGCGELLSMNEIAEMMAAFNEQYPFVKFQLHSAFNNDIKEQIEQGILDLGLLVEPVDISKYDFIRMRTQESWGVLVKDESELAQKGVVRPSDLVGVPLITTNDELMYNELASWAGNYAKEIESAATYNLLYNAAAFLKKKGGAVVCLNLDSSYNGLCFLPLIPALKLNSVLVWKDRQSFSKATAAFIQFIKKYNF